MNEVIFRCSTVGEIMGKTGLGATGEKRAIYSYIEQFEGRFKEIKSKYLEKGNENEAEAIQMINEVLSTDYRKNEKRKTNEYLTGECDIDTGNEIIDVKCSWDRFTFQESKVEASKKYEWQLRGYMSLWERINAKLIFCLTDMPDHMLLKQLDNASIPYNGDLPDHIAIQMVINSIYDKDNFHRFLEMAPINTANVSRQINEFVHIPKKDRIYEVHVSWDVNKEILMYNRIKEARKFLTTIF